MKEETYKQNMHCSNCGNGFVKDFAKGITCRGLNECPRCGRDEARETGPHKDDNRWINTLK